MDNKSEKSTNSIQIGDYLFVIQSCWIDKDSNIIVANLGIQYRRNAKKLIDYHHIQYTVDGKLSYDLLENHFQVDRDRMTFNEWQERVLSNSEAVINLIESLLSPAESSLLAKARSE